MMKWRGWDEGKRIVGGTNGNGRNGNEEEGRDNLTCLSLSLSLSVSRGCLSRVFSSLLARKPSASFQLHSQSRGDEWKPNWWAVDER